MIKICSICGKEFKVSGKIRKLNAKFCSRKCQSEGRKGSIPWNKGTKGIMKPNSGSFKKGDKFWLGKKRSVEDRKSMSDAHIGQKGFWTGKKRPDIAGENCYNWKGGVTPENHKIRHSLEYKLWRKSILERDNFTCQKCKQSGGYLIAHHINNFADFPELRMNIDNGIILCKQCHLDFHSKYGRHNNTREQLEEFLNNT